MKFQLCHSCSCWWQKPSSVPRCFLSYSTMHSTPLPLALLFFLCSHALPGCDSKKQTWIFLLITASRLGSWTGRPPPCHRHHQALTRWVALVIIDSHTKLWTPVTARQLAGSAGNTNAHGYVRQGSELLCLFFLIDEWRIKNNTWWCLASYVWMKPFLAVLIFSSHKSNKRPSCALSTQPLPASKFSLAKWTMAALLERVGTRDGAPEGVKGEPCVDDGNLKKDTPKHQSRALSLVYTWAWEA